MSTSIGFANGTIVNGRVLGAPKYIPAHLNNGKLVDPCCEVAVRVNGLYGTDAKGEPGRKDDFTLTGWNKLADSLARNCSRGKVISVRYEPQSYMGRVFNPDGTMRTDAAGQVITVPKYRFVIVGYPAYGDDSAETIRQQVEAKYRPVNWNTPGHPEYTAWRDFLKTRKGIVWDGRSETFEYAVVRIPRGDGVQLLTPGQMVEMQNQPGGRRTRVGQSSNVGAIPGTQGTGRPATGVVPGATTNPANLQSQVAAALTAPPATAWTPPGATVAQGEATYAAADAYVDY